MNRFNLTSWIAVVTRTDRRRSVRNRFVIDVFGGVFVLPRCFLDFSVSVVACVIGQNQISSLFSCLWNQSVPSESMLLNGRIPNICIGYHF